MKQTIRVGIAIYWKDMQIELRSRELFSTMLVFNLLLVIILNFALELDAAARTSTIAGSVWVILTFTGTLALNRVFATEQEQGTLLGLLLAPAERVALFFAKSAAVFTLMLLTAAILLPILQILYGASLLQGAFLGIVLVGMAGYAIVGVLVAGLSVSTRTRELLLPILMFPLLFPLLLAVIRAGISILEGRAWEMIAPAFQFAIVYDLIFFALTIMVFDYLLEES